MKKIGDRKVRLIGNTPCFFCYMLDIFNSDRVCENCEYFKKFLNGTCTISWRQLKKLPLFGYVDFPKRFGEFSEMNIYEITEKLNQIKFGNE